MEEVMENIDAIERLNQLEMEPIETLTSNEVELRETFEERDLSADDVIEQLEDLLGDSVAF
jgi:hypothetical protein